MHVVRNSHSSMDNLILLVYNGLFSIRNLMPPVYLYIMVNLVGMSLMFTKSIIQHKFYIDIHIEIALKVLIFSQDLI